MEENILSLYACGMSRSDISDISKNLYDVEISPELASKINKKIMSEVTAWRTDLWTAYIRLFYGYNSLWTINPPIVELSYDRGICNVKKLCKTEVFAEEVL